MSLRFQDRVLVGGFLYIVAFGALVFPLLWPAAARRGRYPKFVREAADFLAHANKQDQSDFSKDVLQNIERLIETAGSIRLDEDRTAFFDFRYRNQIEDARYAASMLQLIAEPQYCETLVHRCPWDIAATLHRISNRNLVSRAAKSFVQEIGRQAIISQSSMMAREIGYKGFRVAPVLSQALFEDHFITRHYQPLSGLRYGGLSHINRSTLDRLNHALRSTLAVVLDSHDYWDARSLAMMDDTLSSAAREAHRQVRAHEDRYELVIEIVFGLRRIIEDTRKHLDGIDRKTYDQLYADVERRRDFTVLDYLSETIADVIYAFANDFEGHEDAFWSTAIDLVEAVFGRFEELPGGMDPLQQRVAIKFIDKVRRNMDGYYPALTRVLLPVIGPYSDAAEESPNSAFSILRDAFYAELARFPELYEKDPEKAGHYLPKNIRFDADNAALVRIYGSGKEVPTELRTLSIAPVSFEAEAVRTKPD